MLIKLLRAVALAGAVVLALGMISPSAAAQTLHADETTVTVSLADLDLSEPQNRARAERRLRRAARAACGRHDGWDRWGPRVLRQVRECERAAAEIALARAGLAPQTAEVQWDENRRFRPIQLASAD